MAMLVRCIDLVTLFFLLLCSNSVLATTIKAFSFDELVTQSNLIIQAKVIEVKAIGSGYSIHTQVTFEILDVIKGNYSQANLTLSFAGGTLNNKVQKIVGLRYPKVNEEGIYFIRLSNTPSINPILGWDQGHYILQYDELTQTKYVLTSSGKTLTSISAKATKPRQISNGIANGVKTLKTLNNQKLDVRSFINEIKGRIKP